MEYVDLSPYEYLPHPLLMINVGWLGPRHGLQAANMRSAVDLTSLRAASRRVVGLTLGWHECEFCETESPVRGNGEYRYFTGSGAVYAAPVMILHYIEMHGYRPPGDFVTDLAMTGDLLWDKRSEALAAVVVDKSVDLELRGQAVVDLVNWTDIRTLKVGLAAARDEEFADLAGDKIGFLIGSFIGSGQATDVRSQELPEFVQMGISEALDQMGNRLPAE